MIALAPEDTVLTSACRHRFDNPEGIAGHSLGNLIISALFQMSGGFADASLRVASIQLKGRVLPSTENAMTLRYAPRTKTEVWRAERRTFQSPAGAFDAYGSAPTGPPPRPA